MAEEEEDEDDYEERAVPMSLSKLEKYSAAIDYMNRQVLLNSYIKFYGSLAICMIPPRRLILPTFLNSLFSRITLGELFYS